MLRSTETLGYLEGRASMAAEVAVQRNAAVMAQAEAARWKRKYRGATNALLCAAAASTVLAIWLVILWLIGRGA